MNNEFICGECRFNFEFRLTVTLIYRLENDFLLNFHHHQRQSCHSKNLDLGAWNELCWWFTWLNTLNIIVPSETDSYFSFVVPVFLFHSSFFFTFVFLSLIFFLFFFFSLLLTLDFNVFSSSSIFTWYCCYFPHTSKG